MPFVPAQCTNCGAPLLVDDGKDAAICPYCNTPYVVEKAINNYNVTNNITAQTVNIYGSESKDFEIRGGKLIAYKGESPEVVIPDNVTVIGEGAFKETAVKKVTVPKTVEDFEDNAFVGRIKTVIFEEGRTSIPCIRELNSLKKVVIPEGVECIGNYCFYGCQNLENINIPSTVKEFGNSCFFGCNLKNISIPNGIVAISSGAFQRCKSLESVNIPESVTSIGKNAFSECYSLKNITIPNSVTSIGEQAFRDCQSLKSISIPESVTSVGEGIFRFCRSLERVVFLTDDESTEYYEPYKESDRSYRDTDNCEFSFPRISFPRIEKKQASWRSQGLCQHCGGTFKGLVLKKCMNCGKLKDY